MKRLFDTRNSLCEKFILISLTLIFFIVILDYKFLVLPFHGISLIVYILILILITTWITFMLLHNLLQHNKPFEYDFEKNLFWRFIKKVEHFLQKFKEPEYELEALPFGQVENERRDLKSDIDKLYSTLLSNKSHKQLKNIDERIDDLIRDIEVRFILKWYAHISIDPSFPSESKILLDEIVRKFLQIIVEVDSRKFVYGCFVVFLKHVKEFRRAVKRSKKNGGSIEELYRYSHIGSNSIKAMEHFIFCLTANILRQFINWELWNSLPCRLLVSVLAKKLTSYMLVYISAPGFLNYLIVEAFASDQEKINLKLDQYGFISISDVDLSGNLSQLNEPNIPSVEIKLQRMKNEESNTPALSPRKNTKKIMSVEHTTNKYKDATDSFNTANDVDISKTQTLKDLETPETQTSFTNDKIGFASINEPIDINKKQIKTKASVPVRIFESKSSSTKTWRNSSDLECISLGQDLLAFQEFNDPDIQIQELIGKKLWKDNPDLGEDEKITSMWDIPESWDGDDHHHEITDATSSSPILNLQSCLKSTANTASYITNTIKPIGNVTANTLHNMKELQQSTVNTVNTVVKPVTQATSNAMHRFGDLQDEAAGMVEGILDFGMAGIRKGLRLTGLQENFSDLTQKAKNELQKTEIPISQLISKSKAPIKPIAIPSKTENEKAQNNHKNAAKLVKIPHITSEEKDDQTHSSSESDENVWINPLTKESPGFEGHILLEKTPDNVPSIDIGNIYKAKDNSSTVESDQVQSFTDIPQIKEDMIATIESPELEYEEPQDFATTIAKLRTLLQQKSSESGVTTPALSPMPQDEMSKTPSEQPPTDLTKLDGAMPSLYKFCARTATGVFQNTLNTIKTALPGNVNESNQCVICNLDDWTFIEADSSNDDFYSRMKKLLSERRAFCTIDTAYEAIDSLDVLDQIETSWPATASAQQFDDELDEFDLQVPLTKALIDIVCELIGDANSCLLHESVIKTLLLLIGNYSEEFLIKQADSLLHDVNKRVGKLPENLNQDALAMKLDDITRMCMDLFPCALRKLIGENTLRSGIQLLITSLQSQRINQDLFMQMFELFASELINAYGQTSPAYSA